MFFPRFFLALVACPVVGFAATGEVGVTWDPNPEPDLAGYRLHVGTSSGSYNVVIDIGNQPAAVLPGLPAEIPHFCVLTAYNEMGLESEPSAELIVTYIPEPAEEPPAEEPPAEEPPAEEPPAEEPPAEEPPAEEPPAEEPPAEEPPAEEPPAEEPPAEEPPAEEPPAEEPPAEEPPAEEPPAEEPPAEEPPAEEPPAEEPPAEEPPAEEPPAEEPPAEEPPAEEPPAEEPPAEEPPAEEPPAEEPPAEEPPAEEPPAEEPPAEEPPAEEPPAEEPPAEEPPAEEPPAEEPPAEEPPAEEPPAEEPPAEEPPAEEPPAEEPPAEEPPAEEPPAEEPPAEEPPAEEPPAEEPPAEEPPAEEPPAEEPPAEEPPAEEPPAEEPPAEEPVPKKAPGLIIAAEAAPSSGRKPTVKDSVAVSLAVQEAYILWCRVPEPTLDLSLSFNGSQPFSLCSSTPTTLIPASEPGWVWVRMDRQDGNPMILEFQPGQYGIKMSTADSPSALDRLMLSSDPLFVPNDNLPRSGDAVAVTSAPEGCRIKSGSPYRLSVTAVGSGNLSYQWYKNGTPLPNATSESLSLESPQPSDSGTYAVAVTSGTATSVTQATSITIVGEPFRVTSWSRTGEALEFHLDSQLRMDVQVLASEDLATWEPLASGVAEGGRLVVSDPRPAHRGKRFYKLVTEVP